MKRLMKVCLQGLGGLIACVMLAGTASAASVYVRDIMYAGSGCPAGSLSSTVSRDNMSVSILFDSFVAEAGPGISLREKRKNCQILLDLAIPSGWSYSIVGLEQRGYVSLDYGATATQTTAYYFQGQAATARFSTNFRGPKDEDYVVRDTLGLSSEVWSPCGGGRALNINIQASVNATGRASGLITVDSPIGSTLGQLQLKWRRCS